MIISDLKDIESKILATSSNKEKLFYTYINDEDTSKLSLTETPTDLLCIDAFIHKENKSKSLNQLQRSKPLKNIHYSTNLIDLVAAYLLDPEGEKKHLTEYTSSHSIREAYIISLAVGVEIDKSAKVESSLDHLIKTLIIDKEVGKSEELFTSSLMDVNHVFDLIALMNLYSQFLSIHPDSAKLSNINSIQNTAYDVSFVLDKLIILILSAPIAFFLVKFIFWSFENKQTHVELWDWVEFVSTIILVVVLFLGINVPSKSEILLKIRRSILRVIYKSIGLQYDDVKNILSKGKIDLKNE